MCDKNEYLVWPNGDYLLKEDIDERDISDKSDDFLKVSVPEHIEEDSEEFSHVIETLLRM